MSHLVRRIADLREPYRCPRLDGKLPKASYRSAAKARKAARLMDGSAPRQYAYQCIRCGFWHLSKEPPRDAAA